MLARGGGRGIGQMPKGPILGNQPPENPAPSPSPKPGDAHGGGPPGRNHLSSQADEVNPADNPTGAGGTPGPAPNPKPGNHHGGWDKTTCPWAPCRLVAAAVGAVSHRRLVVVVLVAESQAGVVWVAESQAVAVWVGESQAAVVVCRRN